ncbi:DNA-directed RNA polymerase subunit beta [Planctomycetota bacterium]
MEVQAYGDLSDLTYIDDLTEIQTKPYQALLQRAIPPFKREDKGIEAILREVFPIESPVTDRSFDYISYSLIEPRYTPDECRSLQRTYEYGLKVKIRMNQEEPVEESILLCHIPKMIGGGEFVINGVDRIIVTQINRPPGIDFKEQAYSDGSKFYCCSIIPERGSWINFTISKKGVLHARIDNRIKVPATVLLKVLFGEQCTVSDLLREIFETEMLSIKTKRDIGKAAKSIIVTPIINQETGEIYIRGGERITESLAEDLASSDIEEVEVLKIPDDDLVLTTILDDDTTDYNSALRLLYSKFRPGNPFNEEKARELIEDRFRNPNRYNLGPIGRFRINRKFNLDIPEDEYTLQKEDLISMIHYLTGLRKNVPGFELDDIDHLGNRRIRTIRDQFETVLRRGMVRLKHYVIDKLGKFKGDETDEPITPGLFFKSQAVESAVKYFFQRGELSQIVDQTNPLSQLTHERRLSALGEGGLNRKRAGFKVRDVHISHYGRICPIETPEGGNIGLIVSLGIFAAVDHLGFLTTPYIPSEEAGKTQLTTEKVRKWHLRADEEEEFTISPFSNLEAYLMKGRGAREVTIRQKEDVFSVPLKDIQKFDVSPKQMVGISASLVPFLEHDDANRALMGSNMQRQAVPLMEPQPPVVATGVEPVVVNHTSMVVKAREDGTITYVDGGRVVVTDDAGEDNEYEVTKFGYMNGYTCLNQRPVVKKGQRVKDGDILTDGAGIKNGQLALGRNILVAFMSWGGFNFEDAIIVSEKLVKDGAFTSVNIETFRTETRETKLGREYFTNDIPHLKGEALKNLDENGLVRVGTQVKPGDILVGKIAPKSHTELSPEEKLLLAIFGRVGEDVKNVSLVCKPGVEGVVIRVEKFSRTKALSEDEKKERRKKIREVQKEYNIRLEKLSIDMMEAYRDAGLDEVEFGISGEVVDLEDDFSEYDKRSLRRIAKNFNDIEGIDSLPKKIEDRINDITSEITDVLEDMEIAKDRVKKDDDLPTGVLELARVYVARKCVLQVGDKLAGRHGNKGVISTIVPVEDMPFLEDGTAIEMIFNPLGVPSRMNVGQILETHLGWAADKLGFQAVTPAFEGIAEEEIFDLLEKAGFPRNGKVTLFDGQTGEPFSQQITVGRMYVMKLHHFVIDKIHSRSTGSYSLVTQQPLGGKKRKGGQRFGEMEVWALEAYGASHVLQELLTVKSDDVAGRSRIYESMVKGANILEAGIPLSFEVLRREIMGLALNFELHTK